MSELEIALLGPFQVRLAGNLVAHFATTKVRALLAYLAVENDCLHRRETLAGLLWPEQPESAARLSLRQTLFKLRQVIPPAYLLTSRQTVQFDPNSDYRLDVMTFTALMNDCHRHPHTNPATCRPCLERLQQAVALYRGDFLADFSLADSAAFEEWALLKREWLRREALQALYCLAAYHQQQGDYEAAYPYAWRQVELDSLREEAHQQLMRILALSGRRSEALAQYDACCRVLAEELGVEPGMETTTLYEQIRDEDLNKIQENYTDIPSMPLNPPAFLKEEQQEPIVAECPVFVARERELAHLNEFLQTALAGRSQVVFVIGEAGSGKTTLINEFARRAQTIDPNLIVAAGVGNAYTGIGDPYLPFREVMRMLTGDVESQWAAGIITRDHARRLWHLMPLAIQALTHSGPALINTFVAGESLVNRAAAYETNRVHLADKVGWLDRLRELLAQKAATGGEQSADQNRIFEEFTNILQELARQRPLLLILDDLHWADVSSISLLFHLSRQIVESPILIVGSYRPEEVTRSKGEEQHPLASILSELKRHFGDIWVNLDQDEQTKGRTFVDSFLDTEPNQLGENFRRALARHTEGHPLFTVELIRDMQERGDLQKNKDGRWIEGANLIWDSMPMRVEGVIEKRMDRLDTEQREILKVASVEGEIFTAEVVARVRTFDEQELIGCLSSELDRQHRLVNVQGIQCLDSQRLSRYRFRHNLFQKYLYHSLDEIEKVHLHEAVGLALETLYEGQAKEEIAVVAGQLAWHFETSGQAGKAINYLQLAGDAAACLYACVEAIAYYRRALKLVQHSQVSGNRISHLFSCLGRVLELDSQFDQALANYKKMERLAKQCGDCAMELVALIARINLLAIPTPVHDPAQGRILGEQALILAQELGDREAEAKILWNLLNACQYTTGGLSQAIDYGERALALARELNLREQMAYTLTDISYCYWENLRFDQARRSLHEAEELWREIGNLPLLANSLSATCRVHLMRRWRFRRRLITSVNPLIICGANRIAGWSLAMSTGNAVYRSKPSP